MDVELLFAMELIWWRERNGDVYLVVVREHHLRGSDLEVPPGRQRMVFPVVRRPD
jgi:hypothetical protein